MSFITPVERKDWRMRLLIAAMYLLVIMGALTMVYPFLIMLSGSLKCRVDFDTFEAVPSFLANDEVLFRKFERARYNANMWRYQVSSKSDLESFESLSLPREANKQATADLVEFLEKRDYPETFLILGQMIETGVQPRIQRQFRHALSRRFGGDLNRLNHEMGQRFKNWDQVLVPEMEWMGRSNRPEENAFERFHRMEFRPKAALREFWPVRLEGHFFTTTRMKYQRDITVFNRKFGTRYERFQDIPLARACPAGAPMAKAWEEYVRNSVNLVALRLKPEGTAAWRDFVKNRHRSIEAWNLAYGAHLRSFDEVSMPEKWPEGGVAARDWQAFIGKGDCLRFVEIDSMDFRYRDFLKQKYGDLEKLNAAHGQKYASFDEVPLDLPAYDFHILREHRSEIIWEFLTRNYRQAWDFLVLHGNAFWNTFVYCSLNVLLHMIINPLAAYALSRYRLRFAHWILLFCMLTMAIPAEVGSIPRFLLIREMGLLNTFWALVLPGAAHGFSIFILKGFFDGLPQELYEAASIEGAPERWMFWNVTLSLTKPILAVTALGAFTSAYGAFLFALIICPDESMWTISVWLYQFRQNVSDAVGFAGLVLASLPVLAVFLMAQRVILRGIVLPVEK